MINWQERETPWESVAHPRYQAPIAQHESHRSRYHSPISSLDPKLLLISPTSPPTSAGFPWEPRYRESP